MNEIGLIAQRGKFIIKDPSKVKKLTLNMTYRGGFIAFLNGKQIASASLPKGKIAYDTPAEDYPLDAFVTKDKKGKLIQLHWYAHKLKEFVKQWALRERNSGIIDIDPKLLLKGVNILSIELHRSDYPIECTKKKIGLCFSPVGLAELSLKADTSADNVVSACIKPDTFRIWNTDTWETLTKKYFGNPAEPLKTIKLVGAKNGTFAGQIMISSPDSIEDLSIKTSSLKSAKGEIKAESISCKYGALNPFYRRSERFDLLLETPPVKPGNILPVWIFVKVPKDVSAGVFKGSVEVSIKGTEAISIPIELSVSDWTVPDVKDFPLSTVLMVQTTLLSFPIFPNSTV